MGAKQKLPEGDEESEETESESEADIDVDELDRNVAAEAFAALDKVREEWQAHPQRSDDFRCCVLGGAWTMRNVGRAYDFFCGNAATKRAKDFCKAYSMSQSARFSAELYGESVAATCSAAWCDNMHYFLTFTLLHLLRSTALLLQT